MDYTVLQEAKKQNIPSNLNPQEKNVGEDLLVSLEEISGHKTKPHYYKKTAHFSTNLHMLPFKATENM